MDRIILHCDCNCFYASCELLSRPELRQLPVAVCGDPTERHGIILAKNEPAKRCGVKTAETIYKARQKCPGLILLPPHHQLYDEYSKKINAVYSEYTDLVEPFGIDESWLDVTGSLHLFGGEAKALADTLRNRIRQEFGLTISVGVSFNKVFAKLGSDYKSRTPPQSSRARTGVRSSRPCPSVTCFSSGAARRIFWDATAYARSAIWASAARKCLKR